MGKQQVDKFVFVVAMNLGRDVAKIKHQTMSLLLHIMIPTRPLIFCLRFWKPSADGLGPNKGSTKLIMMRKGERGMMR